MKNKIVILGSKGFVAEETTKVLKQKNKVVNLIKKEGFYINNTLVYNHTTRIVCDWVHL